MGFHTAFNPHTEYKDEEPLEQTHPPPTPGQDDINRSGIDRPTGASLVKIEFPPLSPQMKQKIDRPAATLNCHEKVKLILSTLLLQDAKLSCKSLFDASTFDYTMVNFPPLDNAKRYFRITEDQQTTTVFCMITHRSGTSTDLTIREALLAGGKVKMTAERLGAFCRIHEFETFEPTNIGQILFRDHQQTNRDDLASAIKAHLTAASGAAQATSIHIPPLSISLSGSHPPSQHKTPGSRSLNVLCDRINASILTSLLAKHPLPRHLGHFLSKNETAADRHKSAELVREHLSFVGDCCTFRVSGLHADVLASYDPDTEPPTTIASLLLYPAASEELIEYMDEIHTAVDGTWLLTVKKANTEKAYNYIKWVIRDVIPPLQRYKELLLSQNPNFKHGITIQPPPSVLKGTLTPPLTREPKEPTSSVPKGPVVHPSREHLVRKDPPRPSSFHGGAHQAASKAPSRSHTPTSTHKTSFASPVCTPADQPQFEQTNPPRATTTAHSSASATPDVQADPASAHQISQLQSDLATTASRANRFLAASENYLRQIGEQDTTIALLESQIDSQATRYASLQAKYDELKERHHILSDASIERARKHKLDLAAADSAHKETHKKYRDELDTSIALMEKIQALQQPMPPNPIPDPASTQRLATLTAPLTSVHINNTTPTTHSTVTTANASSFATAQNSAPRQEDRSVHSWATSSRKTTYEAALSRQGDEESAVGHPGASTLTPGSTRPSPSMAPPHLPPDDHVETILQATAGPASKKRLTPAEKRAITGAADRKRIAENKARRAAAKAATDATTAASVLEARIQNSTATLAKARALKAAPSSNATSTTKMATRRSLQPDLDPLPTTVEILDDPTDEENNKQSAPGKTNDDQKESDRDDDGIDDLFGNDTDEESADNYSPDDASDREDDDTRQEDTPRAAKRPKRS